MSRIFAAMFGLVILAGIYFWVTSESPEDDTPIQTDQNP